MVSNFKNGSTDESYIPVFTQPKDYIIIIVNEVRDCFLDKSHSFKVPVTELDTILEYIDNLSKKAN